MIPKLIHYIWIGDNPMSQLSNICVNSWNEKLPDFKVTRWGEKNLDLDQLAKENRFFKECRKRNLYAYMADYIRLRVLYKYGGVYMDTDIQVIKSFEDLMDTDILIGHASYGKIGTGFIAVEPEHPFIKRLLEFYDKEIWDVDIFTIPDIVEYVYKTENYSFKIYEKEYFSPCAYDKPYDKNDITENTRVIHWYEGSWTANKQVVLFLMTKHIHPVVKRRMIQAKKWIGFYLRKMKILK